MQERYQLNMITHRAIEEGIAMEIGKTSPEYFRACSIIEMNELDMDILGIAEDTTVRVSSECGHVIVRAIVGEQTCEQGLCHIRQGVWANQIVPSRTQSTGAPQYSGFLVIVEPAPGESITSALELIQSAVGMWAGGQVCPR
ncbi:MAG TPA: molybdopterin dinucleotide binding domain-containing protein [Methanospirillum sp.]|nr:molybdopterin dinucleotide binding domain-containing protein [Methanospirillum sp.]